MPLKMKRIGSKAEVWHSTCLFTPGGLTKKDLMKHNGRIISRKKHALGKKAIKHLFALGYKPKKGAFTLMRKSMSKVKPTKSKSSKKAKGTRRHSRKHRGGADSIFGVVDPAVMNDASNNKL